MCDIFAALTKTWADNCPFKSSKMSIKKKFLKSKPVCKVTFNLPEELVAGASKVNLMGDFNNWDLKKAESMRKLKDGSYTRTLDLDAGNIYEYRFLVDGETWINDLEADAYVSNGVSYEENCVVEV